MTPGASLPPAIADRAVPLPAVDLYRPADAHRLLTPALLIYPEFVESNVRTIISLLDGNPARWRAHVKSAKLARVVEHLTAAGVTALKCATTLELKVACEAGASDVLLAYPLVGPKVERVKELAREFPLVEVSTLVEAPEAVEAWRGSRVGLFVDVNSGMDRTGIRESDADAIVATARAIVEAGLRFGGVHYYDGHVSPLSGETAEATAHRGYDRLMALVGQLEAAGVRVPEVITAGTPGLPFTLSYPAFRRLSPATDAQASPRLVHRASPGTVVYNDATTLTLLPASWSLRPAAIVAATVVSHPAPGLVTCDAGHKTVSADAGVPTCAVLGRPDLQPLKPSEEHLPIAVPPESPVPAIGDILYLVPRHVCPTVNNFDEAVIVRAGRIDGMERVTARGRESPLADLA